jgi:hypothetical protein
MNAARSVFRKHNLAGCAIAVIAVGILAATYVFAPLAADAPVLRLPHQVHDFAAVLANSKSTCTFTCRNTLWDVLFIDRVDKSCGCTAARADHEVVLPGQTFRVAAILSAPAYSEDLSSHITVRGHAGRRRVEADYELRGTVEDAIEFPDTGGGSVRLGSWRLDELPAITSITVTRGKYPLRFDELRAECTSPAITTRIEPISNEAWRVLIRLKSADTLGATGIPMTFSFAQMGRVLPQRVQRQAYLEMLGPIAASPSSLLLTASPGEHLHKTISIVGRQTGPDRVAPQITAVSPGAKNIIATWQNNSRQSSVLSVDYTAPPQLGPDRGAIIVFLMYDGVPYKLKVGYLAVVS